MKDNNSIIDMVGEEKVLKLLSDSYKRASYELDEALSMVDSHMLGISLNPIWKYESIRSDDNKYEILYDYSMFDLVFVFKEKELVSILSVHEVANIIPFWKENLIVVLGVGEFASLNIEDMSYINKELR